MNLQTDLSKFQKEENELNETGSEYEMRKWS